MVSCKCGKKPQGVKKYGLQAAPAKKAKRPKVGLVGVKPHQTKFGLVGAPASPPKSPTKGCRCTK